VRCERAISNQEEENNKEGLNITHEKGNHCRIGTVCGRCGIGESQRGGKLCIVHYTRYQSHCYFSSREQCMQDGRNRRFGGQCRILITNREFRPFQVRSRPCRKTNASGRVRLSCDNWPRLQADEVTDAVTACKSLDRKSFIAATAAPARFWARSIAMVITTPSGTARPALRTSAT
jgi:hypothetical protein